MVQSDDLLLCFHMQDLLQIVEVASVFYMEKSQGVCWYSPSEKDKCAAS